LLEKCSKIAKTIVIPENVRLRRTVYSFSFQLFFNIFNGKIPMAKSREASGHLGGNDWGRRKFWKFGRNFWSVKAFLLLESLSGALNHLYFSKISGGCAP